MLEKMGALTKPYVNRQYKDTVFRMLAKDKKNLLNMYNAVNGTNYTDVNDLVIVTLESAIYLGYKNDMAFLIGDFLNLYEQQSTYNPNMPLRMLLYVASEYQVLMKDSAIYTTALQRIPTPRFVIFYNGQDKKVEQEELKLSNSFIVPVEEPELELRVTLYNINEGHNQELMEQCRILSEYASYVATVREYAKSMSTKDAVNSAVNYCIEHGILEAFLRENRMEVVKMSIFEYDEEREKKLERLEVERIVAEERRLREEAEKQAADAKKQAEDAKKQVADAKYKEKMDFTTENVRIIRKKLQKGLLPSEAADALEQDEKEIIKVYDLITQNRDFTDRQIAKIMVAEQ